MAPSIPLLSLLDQHSLVHVFYTFLFERSALRLRLILFIPQSVRCALGDYAIYRVLRNVVRKTYGQILSQNMKKVHINMGPQMLRFYDTGC